MNLGLVALIVILSTMALWFVRCFQVKIPKTTPYLFIFCYLLGIVLGCIAIIYQGDVNKAYWAIGLGIVLLYLIFTGAQRKGEEVIEIGDTIPSFSGIDDQGNHFDSNSLEGKRVLIKFFRGFW